jgi:hypothetical protein
MRLPRFVLVGVVIAALAIAMGLAVSWALTNAVSEWETENVATSSATAALCGRSA